MLCNNFPSPGKMLSWASYLFGSGQSSEPQEDVSPKTDDTVAMDTEPKAVGDQDWVVVEHAGNRQNSKCSFIN